MPSRHYNNAFYSRVGGISLAELNSLEVDFLFRLDFQFHVTSNVFERYCTHLERELVLSRPHIERTTPILSGDYQGIEKQRMHEESQRKDWLIMNHKVQSSTVAASAVFEPSALPSKRTDYDKSFKLYVRYCRCWCTL